MTTIAYLGPEGTFSHLLARKRFGVDFQGHSSPDLSAAFEFLKNTPDSQALIPIENSSGGTIYDSADLLIKNAGQVFIQEDLTLDVRIALLGHKNKNPLRIHSHFAPLHHHRSWLEKNYPQAQLLTASSTAEAARQAAEDPEAAALAAPDAGELYGLDVLLFPIRPEAINVTRFYIIGTRPCPDILLQDTSKRCKTAFIFSLKNETGSLHAFLGPLARRRVNLRMIVSRPLVGHPETYVFFVEIEGRSSETNVSEAIAEAKTYCNTFTLLGSFPGNERFAS
ncbi:MAG: prephenate dehydratase [Chthoniobacterales bacterium]